MAKTGKILLGVGCGVVVLAVIAIVGGYFALNYIEARLDASTKQDEAAGSEFGKKTDQQGCIDEGLRRARSYTYTDMSSSLYTQTFVEACLKNAKPVQDFCAGAPPFWDINETKWMVDQCHKAGLDEKKTGCVSVFAGKKNFCSPPSK